jgi:hypothetical protein
VAEEAQQSPPTNNLKRGGGKACQLQFTMALLSHLLMIVLLLCTVSTVSAAGNQLQPYAAAGSAPAAPWHSAGLPQQAKPFTKFSVVELDGKRALRVEAVESYGNLVHSLQIEKATQKLSWRWRVEVLNTAANLRVKEGDDSALKVCALWDLPLENVPFVERQIMRIARAKTAEPLPAATVCYVWDARLAEGTELDSPYTHRLRYVVLRSGDKPQQWLSERRDIGADFLKLFGSESATLPPLIGIAVGADADNTHGRSLGYVADLLLE